MQKPTILLAEDDENDVHLMQRILQRVSIPNSLQIVKNGDEAIAYLSGEGKFSDRETYPFPRLLILDMNMPGKSGKDVLDWLKGKPELERLFVIILSGLLHPTPEGKMFRQLGNVCILCHQLLKPVTQENMELMVTLCERWLRNAN